MSLSLSKQALNLAADYLIDLLREEAIAQGEPQSITQNPVRRFRGNDLSQSRLIRNNLITKQITGQAINILMPEYQVHIENGRRNARTLTGTANFGTSTNTLRYPPISEIIAWMQRKGIATGNNNSVAQAIRRAIALRGIAPRPFVSAAIERLANEGNDKIGEFLTNTVLQNITLNL